MSEANPPNTLDELFARDPMQLTAEDAHKIVDALRAKRAEWELAESKRLSEGKKRQPARTATKEKISVDFDELDFS